MKDYKNMWNCIWGSISSTFSLATKMSMRHNAWKYWCLFLHLQTDGTIFSNMMVLKSTLDILIKTHKKQARYVCNCYWRLNKMAGVFLTSSDFNKCRLKNKNKLNKAKIYCHCPLKTAFIQTIHRTLSDWLFFLYRPSI